MSTQIFLSILMTGSNMLVFQVSSHQMAFELNVTFLSRRLAILLSPTASTSRGNLKILGFVGSHYLRLKVYTVGDPLSPGYRLFGDWEWYLFVFEEQCFCKYEYYALVKSSFSVLYYSLSIEKYFCLVTGSSGEASKSILSFLRISILASV